MSRKIGTFVFLFLLVALQFSLLPHFFGEKNMPNAVILVLIFFAVRRGFSEAWPLAVAAGLLVDFFSSFPVGFHILSFAFSVLTVSLLAKRFLVANSIWKGLVFIFLVIAGVAANDLALLFISGVTEFFLGSRGLEIQLDWMALFFKIAGSLVLFLIIYWPLNKFEKMRLIYNQNLALRKTK